MRNILAGLLAGPLSCKVGGSHFLVKVMQLPHPFVASIAAASMCHHSEKKLKIDRQRLRVHNQNYG